MTLFVLLLYRIALFGLPSDFRNRYDESVVEEARLGLKEAAGRGRLRYFVAIGHLGVDYLLTWAREWRSAAQSRPQGQIRPTARSWKTCKSRHRCCHAQTHRDGERFGQSQSEMVAEITLTKTDTHSGHSVPPEIIGS